MADRLTVGFIGLGTMGGRIARNLQKAQYALVVHDVRREAAEPHIEAGARWADTPREVAEAADVVFTSLPGPPEVEAVVLGDNGVLAGIRPGKAYFDLTTNSPTLVRRLHQMFAEKGAHMLDSPVSGGPAGAESGRMALWVGGEEQVFNDYRDVLGAMGDQARYIGPSGAGTVAKLVHNCVGYIISTAMAEVFALGVKAGVPPFDLWQAVRNGAVGRNRPFDRLPNNFLQGKYDPPDFALRLAHKDVKLAVELGRELSVPMRLANITLEEMTEAMNRGWDGRDSRSAMQLELERAGVEIKVDPALMQAVLDAERK